MSQIYETYWKLTLEYSDFASKNFNECLKIIVDFIDTHDMSEYSKYLYEDLQKEVFKFNPKRNYASVRKSINQFLKLGFINNFLHSYHPKTKDFLRETDVEIKKRIYSEILYDNASFGRSVTEPCDVKEINFLIKTMQVCKSINKDNLSAIMMQNINQKAYLKQNELDSITELAIKRGFINRKYNQVNYLFNICKNILTGIYIDSKHRLTLEKPEFSDSEKDISKTRDAYKQTLYKYDLYNESKKLNNEIICFVENIKYPVLIASHIKPFIKCKEQEQFDSNNGLLLSKNLDYLFDNGWISFKNNGEILCAKNMDLKLQKYLSDKTLDAKYLNARRIKYLEYHRKYVFDDDKSYKF
ncbi:hypothetical protein DMB92_06300 [Campylobacter sp. MIT 99-7217]|uniref:HNH endonuclease signature motif containing protein n=1 Tax=Campylobacter sp. MIT 99-7217 TaxID=535091 RepID=UPI001157AA49|nr:HNH endonuclease signature motif containing protein [Campylobacter sp. MIT 99-7217]TQR31298.1 hypothetical protein DMB92_06300 [Campylobacter sp. MIT 99-7217]